jgi:large subunit ribosomal protein L9
MRSVQVILSEDVPNLGDAGELVSVKPGFARNYLLPLGKAVPATEASRKELEHKKRVIAEKIARERKLLEGEKARFEGQVVEITAQAGEEGKLFGSVTAQDVADALGRQGHSVDRRRIELEHPIKSLGEHLVTVRLHPEVHAEVRVSVVAE